jgi:hypothetical protein
MRAALSPARFSGRRGESRFDAVAAVQEGERDAHDRCGPADGDRAGTGFPAFESQLRLLASLASRPRGAAVKTQREKSEEKRQAKLEQIREQVDSGTLVIRPMTPEERRQYPPRPVERKRFDRR